jgi:hypothetical protein
LNTGAIDPEKRASLRQGVVANGGVNLVDRPLVLRLRQPQLSMSRSIEHVIDQRFQNSATAAAKDEALIAVHVPEQYAGDWEHFAQVITHMFLNTSPDFAVNKARELAAAAVEPDAPLLDISYCWEALGPLAVPFITPLAVHEKQDVAFAAARAAAALGDSAAEAVLMAMARDNTHSFQINAVQVLAKRPPSPVIHQVLRELLDSDKTLVRLEAYRALAANGDPSIIAHSITRPGGGESFVLDIVPSQGPPLVYATRTGTPRIAVIGNKPQVNVPLMFTAMENQLTISGEPGKPIVTIFYRGPEVVHRKKLRSRPTRDAYVPPYISIASSPDLAEVIARLGGNGRPGEEPLDLSYCEVVAIVQALGDQQRLSGQHAGQKVAAAFVLQESPQFEQSIEQAPMIPDQPGQASLQTRPGQEDVGEAVSSGMSGSGRLN